MKKKYPKYLKKGMKFNRLTVIEVDESSKIKNGKRILPSVWKYICKCDCGNTTLASKHGLISNNPKSCGCIRKETVSKRSKKTNRIEECGDYIKVFFFNKENTYTIINKNDYPIIKNYCWRVLKTEYGNTFYACASLRSTYNYEHKNILMHRLLLSPIDEYVVDHKDGNGLNNRRNNIRICTHLQTSMNRKKNTNNSSGIAGVFWSSTYNKWEVGITIGHKQRFLGRFTNKEDAIKARKEGEEKYRGEYSFDNSRGVNE